MLLFIREPRRECFSNEVILEVDFQGQSASSPATAASYQNDFIAAATSATTSAIQSEVPRVPFNPQLSHLHKGCAKLPSPGVVRHEISYALQVLYEKMGKIERTNLGNLLKMKIRIFAMGRVNGVSRFLNWDF